MRSLIGLGACLMTACALLLAPQPAAAQDYFSEDFRPVLVVSVASVDEVMDDFNWLTKSAGFEDEGRFFGMMGMSFVGGWEKKSPAGMVVGTDGEEFTPLVFIPVRDIEAMFDVLEQNTGQRPEEEDEGLYVFEGPAETVYIREENGYAFFTKFPEDLEDLPGDPAGLLGDLPSEYTMAAKVYVQNVPEAHRQFALDSMQQGMEMGLSQRPGETDEQFEMRSTVARLQMQQIVDVINAIDQLQIGLSINDHDEQTYLDITVTALEDTKLAEQIASMADAQTLHSGFLLPGAAVTLNFVSDMGAEDIERTLTMLEQAEKSAIQGLENSEEIESDKQREAAAEVISGLFQVVGDTVRQGHIDGGAALVLENGSLTFVAGGTVADGGAMEQQFDRLVDLAEDEPDFPGVEREVLDYQGVIFHRIVVPVEDDREAQRVFGDEVEILIGFGDESFYFTLGNDCETVVKQVLDASASPTSEKLPPMQFNVALTPILQFAAELEGNQVVGKAARALEDRGGDDRIRVTAQTEDLSVNYRVIVESGVLEAIGTAVQAAAAGEGGPRRTQPAF